MTISIITLLAIILSYFLTGSIINYTIHRGIIDVPNQRSSHNRPVPRGGGLAIVAVTVGGWVGYQFIASPGPWLPPLLFLAGALLVAGVSWLDDLHSLPNRMRFTAHLVAALLAVWAFGYWPELWLPLLGRLELGWLGAPLTIIWIAGLINAYNFMDGIDGIAGSQGLAAGLGWAIVGGLINQPAVVALGLLLAAGNLGFLGYNWPPARIFMGDVGSAFLGYCFAVLPLMAGLAPWSGAVVAGVLLLWPFLFDSIFTFLRRLSHGENVFAAHRSHLYQRLTIAGLSHQTVTLLYAGLAGVGLLLSLAWTTRPQAALLVALSLPLLALSLWYYVTLEESHARLMAGVTERWTGSPLKLNVPRPVKRGLDSGLALMALLLLSPLLLAIALLLKLSGRSPLIEPSHRAGLGGRPFRLYNFNIGSKPEPGWGYHLLHDSKLYALPQLFNLLRGDVTLVGPRPELRHYVDRLAPAQQAILKYRPGLISPATLYYWQEKTSLAQTGRDKLYFEKVLPHKQGLDTDYLQHRTVWSDLKLMARSLLLMVTLGQRSSRQPVIRNRYIMLMDVAALLLTPAVALTLRLDTIHWGRQFGWALLFYTGVSLVIKIGAFYSAGLYRRFWHYASINDAMLIVTTVGLATVINIIIFVGGQSLLAADGLAIPRGMAIIDGMLTVLAAAGLRFGLRGMYHYYQRQSTIGGRRVLIVGAGEAGSLVIKEMRANPQLEMEPIAFVDDDPAKVGSRIHNLPVLGPCHEIERLVEVHQIQHIVMAIPSAPLARQHEILNRCRQTGRAVYSLPGVYELLAGHKSVSRLPYVDTQRLLQREPIKTDQTQVAATLHGAMVLVTGAGGSIGSELCRQIARCGPKAIVLLGHGENSIFEISLDLRLAFPDMVIHPTIVDVRDKARIDRVVKKYRPDIIFHAAAHKHVPFMQENAEEALTNNVQGTQNVLEAAELHGVKRFVLISTDKAVNPTSIMGATKRLAELLTIGTAQRTGRAFMAVRFGNVLGSRGSVIPIFQRQIAAGGPITITHPDMERYFMTIPEAVQLVLHSAALGHGGELFVLDMGRQVRIETLAADLIKLSGLQVGRDIDIVYSGIRPGEKLREELFFDSEAYSRTRHTKIYMARDSLVVELEPLKRTIKQLVEAAQAPVAAVDSPDEQLLARIIQVIEQYQPNRDHPRRSLNPRTITDTLPKLV